MGLRRLDDAGSATTTTTTTIPYRRAARRCAPEVRRKRGRGLLRRLVSGARAPFFQPMAGDGTLSA
jgi:hypothetical protein